MWAPHWFVQRSPCQTHGQDQGHENLQGTEKFHTSSDPKLSLPFENCLFFFIVSPSFRFFFFLVSIAFALTASNFLEGELNFSHPLSTELFNLLGGPLWHGDSTEDLWDLFPRFKDAEGMGAFSGGGQKSRPSQDWQSESLRVVISRPTQMAEALDRMPLLKWFWFIIV